MAALVETVQSLVQESTPTAVEVQEAPGRHHHNENIIPAGTADLNADERPVYLIGRMFGQMRHNKIAVGLYQRAVAALKRDPEIAAELGKGPSPVYHWAVAVGPFVHQLQSTEMYGDDAWNYYNNITYDTQHGGWDRFDVGTTRFNDISIKDAATEAMNETPELYNAFTNNCQHYALRLVDKIIRNGREQRFLTANGYQSLEVDGPEPLPAAKMHSIVQTTEVTAEPATVEVAVTEDPEAMRKDLLNVAGIMADNTPVLTVEQIEKELKQQ